ncbi:MAG: molybdenum cofactor guanylyltransferase [Bryobacterales bacterium]|nr:molybdenum cofactor guanylyltransferase [Bryobacterales bacterium]
MVRESSSAPPIEAGGEKPHSAGFVLTGGASQRMGRDKALLPYENRTLVEHVAAIVAEAAGSAVLVGAPERYPAIGLRAIADTLEPCGPLGGILTALRASEADWNLIVACDMPGISTLFLHRLLEAAQVTGAQCLLPVSPDGRVHPLCAVYHRSAVVPVEEALRRGTRKVRECLRELRVVEWPVNEPSALGNVNTPGDWETHHSGQ